MTADEPVSREDAIGAQAERTEMAWVRTTLASAALAAAAGHLADANTGLAVALTIGAIVATPGLVGSWWRSRGLRAGPVPDPPRAAGVALLVATVVVADVLVLTQLLS